MIDDPTLIYYVIVGPDGTEVWRMSHRAVKKMIEKEIKEKIRIEYRRPQTDEMEG